VLTTLNIVWALAICFATTPPVTPGVRVVTVVNSNLETGGIRNIILPITLKNK